MQRLGTRKGRGTPDLDDLLHNVAVLVSNIARVHLDMVVALHCGQLYLDVAAGQLYLPWLRLHLYLHGHVTCDDTQNAKEYCSLCISCSLDLRVTTD